MKQDYEKLNIGICLLRMFACFEVVCCHFWTDDRYAIFLLPFNKFRGIAASVFMILSFYLLEPFFCFSSVEKLRKRVYRIIWPQFVWAIIYWGTFWLSFRLFGIGEKRPFSSFLWQIFTGHSPEINPSMWFNTDLLLLTLFLFLIFRAHRNKERAVYCVICLSSVCLFLEYSGLNFSLFGSLRYELKYPCGRLIEMFPCAGAGLALAYYKLDEKLKKNRWMALIGAAGISIAASYLNFSDVNNKVGFGYSGINVLICSIMAVLFALLLPFESCPFPFKRIIIFASRHTLGIYCMHRLIAEYINKILSVIGMESGTFASCVLIYAVSFILSELISKIPIKAVRQFVD